jgi:hypothetical protein
VVPVGSGNGARVGAGGALGVAATVGGATVGGATVGIGLAVGVTAATVGDDAGTVVIQPLAATAVRMSSDVSPGRMVGTWRPRGDRSAGA